MNDLKLNCPETCLRGKELARDKYGYNSVPEESDLSAYYNNSLCWTDGDNVSSEDDLIDLGQTGEGNRGICCPYKLPDDVGHWGGNFTSLSKKLGFLSMKPILNFFTSSLPRDLYFK